MPLVQGQVDLILTNDDIELQIQDEVNVEKLTQQLNEQAEHLVSLYGYDIKLPQKASKSKRFSHKKQKSHNVFM